VTAHAFFRRLLTPAEDPRERFPDTVDLHAVLQRVRASLRQLEERSHELRERTVELDSRARQALAAGDQTGARDALFLRERALVERNELETEARRLSLGEQRLATLIDTYVARDRLTHVRRDAAEAGVQIAEALAGLSGAPARPDDVDVETKIRDLEARAAAIDELVAAGILDTGGDIALADAVGRRLEAIEDELAVSDEETRPPRLRRG
jgi:phage shock protein A